MKHLNQVLDTGDDSFSYTVVGEDKPRYHVDCSGKLFEHGKRIGAYKLRDKHWELYIGDQLIECSPQDSLFGLPEFELASLTRLVNR